MPSIIQPSFAAGEISPNLYSRVDLQRWASSLKVCRNFITQPYGGAKNRPGTKLVAEVKDSTKHTLLVPFRRSATESFLLELGNTYVRTYKAGVYKAEVTGLPYTTTDLDTVKFAQSVDVLTLVHPSYPNANLSRTSDTSWSYAAVPMLTGPWLELNIDTTISLSVDKTVGTATLRSTKAIFNTTDHKGRLVYIEQRGYGKPWEVQKSITKGDIRRSDGKYYQALNTATTGTLRPVHTTDTWMDGDTGVNWLYLHSGYGVVRVDSVTSTTQATVTILSRLPDELSASGTGFGTLVSLTGATYSDAGDGFLNIHKVAHGITTLGASRVFASGSPLGIGITSTTVDDIKTDMVYSEFITYFGSFDSIEPPPASGSLASDRWKFSAWGASQGWPGCVFYFQNRRGYAASTAQARTVWMSRSNAYNDFSLSVPIQDDDPLTVTLASSQIDDIRGVLSMDKLVVLTSGAEWAFYTGREDVATPANTVPKPQGYRGASDLAPLGVGESALFVQNKGAVVRDLDYNISKDKYAGDDLTVFADHLLEGKSIVSWTYQQHPFGIVWMVRNDGELLGMTYLKEQQVVGWHRHDTSGGLVESVCCVPEGAKDVVYLIVQRTINGTTKRFIEQLQQRLVTDIKDAWFVDCGLSYDGRVKTGMFTPSDDFTTTTMTISGGTNWDETEQLTVTSSAAFFVGASDVGDALHFETTVDDQPVVYRLAIEAFVSTTQAKVRPSQQLPSWLQATARLDWQIARDTFTIPHLPSTEVSVLADGYSRGRFTTGATGTLTLDSPGVRVIVGLPIQADLQTLSVNAGQETLVDKNKRITGVAAQVLESRGLKAGRDFDHLYAAKERSTENYDTPARLQDGTIRVPISTGWGLDGTVCIRQDEPLPLTITALIPEVDLGSV